jgi:hypothetical protein
MEGYQKDTVGNFYAKLLALARQGNPAFLLADPGSASSVSWLTMGGAVALSNKATIHT